MHVGIQVNKEVAKYIEKYPNDPDAISTFIYEIINSCMDAVDDAYLGYDKYLEIEEYKKIYSRIQYFVNHELSK